MLVADTGTGPWVSAAVAIVVALGIATAVDRVFRAKVVRQAAVRTGISREATTRLRFVRRLLYTSILLIGVGIALSGFTGVSHLAHTLLASGVIAAAIVGFAARQVLANFVAGIMLAVTQPIRVGDWVTIEGNYGEVVDVRLNYTVLKSGDARIVVPNERLAGGILRNDTLVADSAAPDASVWVAPDADVERALTVLAEETGKDATVAEALPWGVRLAIGSEPVPPAERVAREAELRRRCVARLRAEGLLQRP